MTRAAWEALSDPDAPLLADDMPDLNEPDGSTLWTVGLDLLTANYGPGRTARIVVPVLGSREPFRLVMTEGDAAVFEGVARDTLEAMERADTEAEALGWRQRHAFARGGSAATDLRLHDGGRQLRSRWSG